MPDVLATMEGAALAAAAEVEHGLAVLGCFRLVAAPVDGELVQACDSSGCVLTATV